MITKFNEFVKLHENVQPQAENTKGEIIGKTDSTFGKNCVIYKNPKDLSQFKGKCRIILSEDKNKQLNLFVAASDIFHVEMLKFLQEQGQIDTKFEFTNDLSTNAKLVRETNEKAYNELKKVVLLTRDENTNRILLSQTYNVAQLDYEPLFKNTQNLINKANIKYKGKMEFFLYQESSDAQKERHTNIGKAMDIPKSEFTKREPISKFDKYGA